MLPVLLHRVGNAAQLLTGLDALMAVDPLALETRADDLASTSDLIDEVGWLLALAASASGSHLLLERRERAGLGPLIACVRACLRREERDLELPAQPLPWLSPGVADGWQLPWAMGSLLYFGGRSLAWRESLRWTLLSGGETWRIACTAADGFDSEGWIARTLESIPPARFLREGNEIALELPRGWLLEAGASP